MKPTKPTKSLPVLPPQEEAASLAEMRAKRARTGKTLRTWADDPAKVADSLERLAQAGGVPDLCVIENNVDALNHHDCTGSLLAEAFAPLQAARMKGLHLSMDLHGERERLIKVCLMLAAKVRAKAKKTRKAPAVRPPVALNASDQAIAGFIKDNPGCYAKDIAKAVMMECEAVRKRMAKGMPLHQRRFRQAKARKGYFPPA